MSTISFNAVTSLHGCDAFLKDHFKESDAAAYEQALSTLEDALSKKSAHRVFGAYSRGRIVGLFAFLVLPEEAYIEMLLGLLHDKAAYAAMLEHLKEGFVGFTLDLVFDPRDELLVDRLKAAGASFESEQQKMIFQGEPTQLDTADIEPLSEPYIGQYIAMHNKDMYWTGDKVVEASDRFRVLTAISGRKLVGYIDVTCCFDENEPFDLLVMEEYRRKGYGKKLLAKALEMNMSNKMMLLVDIDNATAISLYESLGFEKAVGQNTITAHLQL